MAEGKRDVKIMTPFVSVNSREIKERERERQRRLMGYLTATAFAAVLAGLVTWVWTDEWMWVVTGGAAALALIGYAAAAAPETPRDTG